jgi:hypothetical protein
MTSPAKKIAINWAAQRVEDAHMRDSTTVDPSR